MNDASTPSKAELSEQSDARHLLQHLQAIIEGSEDAILTKDLDGIITSWNPGAQVLFGYSPDEVIGKPINLLIPAERQDEEPEILARIRRGDRIEHYETIRQSKDGRRLDVSLTVSPLRRPDGTIYGASKIARDITRQKRSQRQQELLLSEMQHRIKNVFSLATGLVRICAKSSTSQEQLASVLEVRLSALARAHALISPTALTDTDLVDDMPTLEDLLRALAAPFIPGDGGRLRYSGEHLPLTVQNLTSLALLFGELMTNASKYGAFSDNAGSVEVSCHQQVDVLHLEWRESATSIGAVQTAIEGFGSRLIRTLVEDQLAGTIVRHLSPSGLRVEITISV